MHNGHLCSVSSFGTCTFAFPYIWCFQQINLRPLPNLGYGNLLPSLALQDQSQLGLGDPSSWTSVPSVHRDESGEFPFKNITSPDYPDILRQLFGVVVRVSYFITNHCIHDGGRRYRSF